MQKILLILSLLMLQNVFAQTANDSIFQKKWIDNLLDDENISTKEFSSFRYVDYTDLIKTNVSDLPLGYIGENFERFQIIFTSVTKEEFGNETYFIKGKSMVKNNVCDFIGNITITHKSYYKNAKLLSNLYADTVKVGLFTGTYRFTEKEDTRPHSGIFSGNFAIRFYICGHSACLDDLTIIDDNYSNNQFVGTWKSYDGKITLPCNFANFRIPQCGDLDVGKKDFFPNEKYKANGWQTYPELLNTDWWK